jgi:DNA-binding FadR family transcriptional regulator
MTDHMAEERIRESMETTGAKLLTEEVVHLAICDECSRLVAAIYREHKETAREATKDIYGVSGTRTNTAGEAHKWI